MEELTPTNLSATFFVMGNILYHSTPDRKYPEEHLLGHPRANLAVQTVFGMSYGVVFGLFGLATSKITQPKFYSFIIAAAAFWLISEVVYIRVGEEEKQKLN